MVIMKRTGMEVPFDPEKIYNAIMKAIKEIELIHPTANADELDRKITDRLTRRYESYDRTVTVEEVQEDVETQLMEEGLYEVAKAYIRYRHTHKLNREENGLLKKIQAINDAVVSLDGSIHKNEEADQENSNKNPMINSTQRDYMAGEVSKAITKNVLLPKRVWEAHEQGIIHFHDADYFSQHSFNCFASETRFVTRDGVTEFGKCQDGQEVEVLDANGNWRPATVHKYGQQAMYDITFIDDTGTKTVTCTKDHRWILEDGSITTELKVGDKLWHFKAYESAEYDLNESHRWIVSEIVPHDSENAELYDAWCVEEPVTHSFTLDGGMVTGNCCLPNLEDMLQNGTVITGTLIEKPHSFSTACNIMTQAIAQIASNQYGGQTMSLKDLAPFVDVSRKSIRKKVVEEFNAIDHEVFAQTKMDLDAVDKVIDEITEKRLKEEINRGCQIIQYQINTLLTTNGQAPFVTLFMALCEAESDREKHDLAMIIEEMLKQRIQGVKNEAGVWVSPAFPKLVYVLEECNMNEDGEYYYLTKLAAKCTAKRLVPDYVSAKKELELKGDIYGPMGCRSFLTPDRFTDAGIGNIANAKNYKPGKHKYYGRFNQGVVTINLPDVGLSALKFINDEGKEYASEDEKLDAVEKKFWEILEQRLDLCHEALQARHNHLKGTLSDSSPIHFQYGAIARLEKGETIDRLLYDGYSTISLGYAGLYECVKAVTGESHTNTNRGKKFGLAVMQSLNDHCKKWKAEENIDYSVYGTPIESTTYKFAKCLQKRFGIIPGITDKQYITNSYHVHVTEPINAFDKLTFEAEFQALSPGGAISYIETANLQDNEEAVLAVMRHIYDHILYAELNTKSDYCQVCGWDGEIEIVKNKDNKLIWRCPNCGNTNKDKMNIARRTCGLTTN